MKVRIRPLTLIVLLLLQACAAHQFHPGALNKADSVTYDGLLIAQAVVEHGRTEFAAGTLSDTLKPAFNRLIDSYNLARTTWLAYRSAIKAGGTVSTAAMKQASDAMTNALNAFNQAREIK